MNQQQNSQDDPKSNNNDNNYRPTLNPIPDGLNFNNFMLFQESQQNLRVVLQVLHLPLMMQMLMPFHGCVVILI
jgi:hypothetical protein